MNILLTNDDGYQARGLIKLYDILHEKHQITVVAPESERSAVSHAITISEPVKVLPLPQLNGYAVRGTPADCVKLALLELMPQKPDLVISGINHGTNLGNHAIYSGTVAAANDAAMLGFPALAVSQERGDRQETSFTAAANFIADLLVVHSELKIPPGLFLSVNVPDLPENMIKGIKFTPQSPQAMIEGFSKCTDPRGNAYYWLATNPMLPGEDEDSDIGAISRGYIAVTPMGHDLTNFNELKRLRVYSPIVYPLTGKF
ncbi:MAG: 5'/3'-nucleotidase SurE [Desulfarculales bacterium]|jgi:5'-nucleotidase|nr:5'/3'-nucleotidase SurE [Desulfarculales bacterium]